MKNQLKQELSRSFKNVAPDTRQEHLDHLISLARDNYNLQAEGKSISFWNFMLRQIRFVGTRIWLWQSFVLLLLCILISSGYSSASVAASVHYVSYLLGCSAVVMLTAAMPIVYRSVRYQMLETETASRFSFSKLLLARLIIIGAGDLIMMMVIILLTLYETERSIRGLLLYLLVPFLLAASGYLTILAHMALRLFPYLCTGFSGGLLLILYLLRKWQPEFYGSSFTWEWGILCILLLLFCRNQLAKISRRRAFTEGQYTMG